MNPTVNDEAVSAAHKKLWPSPDATFIAPSRDDIRAALTAALPHLSGVSVKPLEWKPNGASGVWTDELVFGVYYTAYDEGNGWRCFRGQFLSEAGQNEIAYGFKDAVLSAAQADYESRILSTLSTPAPNADRGKMVKPKPGAPSGGYGGAEVAEARLAEAMEVLEGTIALWDRNTCLHEDTTRGGAIWTACQSCGAKWADDEGGFQPYHDPHEIADARTFLQSLGKEG